jgi:hypothetical protein
MKRHLRTLGCLIPPGVCAAATADSSYQQVTD